MARKNRNLQAIADRWVQNGTASVPKYKDSIMSLVDNPLQKAADAGALYLQRIQEAEAQGKRKAGLEAFGFDRWKQVTASKGGIRLGQGMAESKDRYMKQMGVLLPFIDSTVESLPPRGSLDQNILRSSEFQRRMASYRKV